MEGQYRQAGLASIVQASPICVSCPPHTHTRTHTLTRLCRSTGRALPAFRTLLQATKRRQLVNEAIQVAGALHCWPLVEGGGTAPRILNQYLQVCAPLPVLGLSHTHTLKLWLSWCQATVTWHCWWTGASKRSWQQLFFAPCRCVPYQTSCRAILASNLVLPEFIFCYAECMELELETGDAVRRTEAVVPACKVPVQAV